MSTSFDDAKEPEKQAPSETQKIKDVHIGVFFDGTNNNMVQTAYFHTYKSKKIAPEKKQPLKNKYENISGLLQQQKELMTEIALATSSNVDSINMNAMQMEYILAKQKELESVNEKIDKFQVETKINTNAMYADSENGYSNVAILHSLVKYQFNTSDNLYHNLYIEGSGANDIQTSHGYTWLEGNINGLGFGLGNTGVTALVSKAIKHIYSYLKSNISILSDQTKYHFYVFGFSRGSTCARLFAELATRDIGKKLKREKEFGQDTSKAKSLYDEKNERLPFMETEFLIKDGNGVYIERKNVTVDFLGIYDTVASIGFLKQKDGWTNALSLAYRGFWWNNYHGNFHYMNAHDYGLYSPHNDRVLHTCHICAADEFRENFALVNLGKSMPKNAMEIIIPGCHSDVGGGYVTKTDMDIVLYKFVPRKLEHFIKSNKLFEILGFFYLKSKDRAKMFLNNPMDKAGQKETLSPNTLATLGWVGKEWFDNSLGNNMDLAPDGKPYTLRVADWPNEIKFKRYALGGYGNIPLNMMKNCVETCGIDWLFKEKTDPYCIPEDLKTLGDSMISKVAKPAGQRVWLMPNGGYSGSVYRKLRLKYLHFTSSCEIIHFRTKVDKNKSHEDKDSKFPFTELERNWGNFGNNCNYDNDANICRIMYDGDETLSGDHTNNVHYMYEMKEYGAQQTQING